MAPTAAATTTALGCRACAGLLLMVLLASTGAASAFSFPGIGGRRSLAATKPKVQAVPKVVLPDAEKPPAYDSSQPMPSVERVMTAPTDCSGFAQKRVYLESQAWFTPDIPYDGGLSPAEATNAKSMHLHVGACVPHRQWIAGVLGLRVLLQKHDFNVAPSDVDLNIQFEWNSKNTTVKWKSFAKSTSSAWNCTYGTDNSTLCKQVVTIYLPTKTSITIVSDGLNEMRFEASASINAGIPGQVNKRTLTARFSSWLVVNNNRNILYPERLLKPLMLTQLANFPTPWGYTHAELIDEPLGLRDMRPINGTLSLGTAHRAQAKTANVTGVLVSVDPSFHKVVVDLGNQPVYYPNVPDLPVASCPFNNKTNIDCRFEKNRTLKFNTSDLDDGVWHKMFLRTDSFVPSNDPFIVAFNAAKKPKAQIIGGTISGVFLAAFRTNNSGNAPQDPLPSPESVGVDPNTLPGPPTYFSPPDGVVTFNGSQQLPPTNATFNIGGLGYRCPGWLEPRVYLEAQTWMTVLGTNITSESKHLHVGACMPERQRISGKFPVDILLQKHLFAPGDGAQVSIKVTFIWNKDLKLGNITYELSQSGTPTNWTCTADGRDCRALYSAWVDTKPSNGAWLVPDGLNRLQLEATTTVSDGNSSRTISARLMSTVVVANNRDTDISAEKTPVTMLARTKEPWAYTHTEMRDNLPLGPQSGTLSFTSSHFILTQLSNITSFFVSVDPAFHKASGPDIGTVLIANDTVNRPDLCPVTKNSQHVDCMNVKFQLDTTKFSNGVHKLFMRTDSFVAGDDPIFEAINAKLADGFKIGAGTFSSALLVAIEVDNGPPPQQDGNTVQQTAVRGARSRRRANAAARTFDMAVLKAPHRTGVSNWKVVEYNP